MNNYFILSLLSLCIVSITGCCTVRLVSPQKAFENNMDDEIGKHIQYKFSLQIQGIIKQEEGVYGDIVVARISDSAISYTEPLGKKGCKVTRIIDDEKWVILSWSYASSKELCAYEDRLACLPLTG